MSKEHKYIELENLGRYGNDFSNLSFLIIDLNILLICLSLPGREGGGLLIGGILNRQISE